ncbi:nucleotidyltransferase domain-containing protein [Candidatus Poriferisodalis sp.]|uniref:nucleotidyltransferase domain-containing protein n=1 Tax=Candidatus Poriferisodalis sp. TaxID=3101277 RepID=UPI003B01FE96
MAVRDETLLVPTLRHASAAAEVLAAEGAAAVLVFGSVADGTSRAGSDIDLVAVFDDIDYDERYPLRWRLEARCAAAVGVPVDVHVTDRPEWEHRIGQVASSFEGSVARRAEVLLEREPLPGAVDWGKEIGMPDSDLNEAVERLNDVCQSLGDMAVACRQRVGEIMLADGHNTVVPRVRMARLRSLCAAASMTIEHALKAWHAANGVPSERTHSIARLLASAGPLPAALEDALAPLEANTLRPSRERFDDVSSWRIGGTYPSALPRTATSERTERLARLLARAATVTAESTLERVIADGADPDSETVAACMDELSRAQAVLSAGDPVNGAP